MRARVPALAMLAFLALVAGCVACGHSGRAGSNNPVLKIACPVERAEVWLDERFVGQVRTMPAGIRVSPGTHRVEIRHDRHHTRYFEVTLAVGETRTLEVEMAEALP